MLLLGFWNDAGMILLELKAGALASLDSWVILREHEVTNFAFNQLVACSIDIVAGLVLAGHDI